MDFKEQKKKINELLGEKEKAEIVRKYKISTSSIYRALLRDSIEEMTKAEKKAWKCILKHADFLIRENNSLSEKTQEIAEKIS